MSLLSDSAKHDLQRQLQACQSQRRRNGKVARLPLALRDQINRMLDDGVPYKTIIARLGEPGRRLSENNISNWRQGGFQDYLSAQRISDRARAQTEAAADALRQNGQIDPLKLNKACQQIALLQYMGTLLESGERIAQESLKKNPAKMITLINACCNLANAGIAIEKRNWLKESQAAKTQPPSAERSNPAQNRSETPHAPNPIQPNRA